jgi:hypothetical protein
MRGGTSRGPYFKAADLPADLVTRDRVLLAVMGSPDVRQIDGIGGATSLTSKVAIVGPSMRDGADVEYLFAQVSVAEAIVDTAPNCGNMIAGVGPFAIESGFVKVQGSQTLVRIFNVNTGTFIEAHVQTPDGMVTYDGDCEIDGVPSSAAPIALRIWSPVGSKTGKLLPTGNIVDEVEEMRVSCVDVAVPMVIADASAFGKSGYETAKELNQDRAFYERLEMVRLGAALKMGLGDARSSVLPKFCIVARPKAGGTIASRYFVPTSCHEAYAVTGGACLASACVITGSIAHSMADLGNNVRSPSLINIEHPSGSQGMEVEHSGVSKEPDIRSVATLRTARRIFEGNVLVPAGIWPSYKAVVDSIC